MRIRKKCSIDGCDNNARAHTWCSCHLTRWTKYGDPNIVHRTLPGECGNNTGYNRHLRNNEQPCPACVKAHLSQCGTPAGWNRHKRSKEKPCEACTSAHATDEDSRAKRRATDRARTRRRTKEADARNAAAKRLVAENLARFQEIHADERRKAGLQ